MPNTEQSKKRMRQNEKARQSNKIKNSLMKTAVKKVMNAGDEAAAKAALPEAMKRIDKCAKHNIIHDNAAARKKAQLAKHVSGL
ncbi:MAG: 30S ribosomal protein S20 [Planctomycetota bacterium]|nr:30S ribosomal protein S20 [Planctomycetota bacterium]